MCNKQNYTISKGILVSLTDYLKEKNELGALFLVCITIFNEWHHFLDKIRNCSYVNGISLNFLFGFFHLNYRTQSLLHV